MGIVEIIFSIILFCIIWFIIFKVKLIYDEKMMKKNLIDNIKEQEDKEFIIDGKKIKISKKFNEEKPKEVIRK